MSVFDDLLNKAKSVVDRNGDGKIDGADLEAMKDGATEEVKAKLTQAQDMADKNDDGKIDFEDLKGLASDAGKTAGDLAGKAGDMAGDVAGKVGDAAKGAVDAAGNVVNDVKDKLFGKK